MSTTRNHLPRPTRRLRPHRTPLSQLRPGDLVLDLHGCNWTTLRRWVTVRTVTHLADTTTEVTLSNGGEVSGSPTRAWVLTVTPAAH